MSDTWVALDGRDPTTFFSTCWICDCGTYTGTVPAAAPMVDVSWVPGDAGEVDWFIALPKGDGDATHVADGTYLTQTYKQVYLASGSSEVGSPGDIDSGADLFAVWFDPAMPSDPALLVTPSASPLDLVPPALVSGGRLGSTMSSVATIDVFAMPISMSSVQPVTAGAVVSLGVFDMPIDMPPLYFQVAGPDAPPADWTDLATADPVYSEDGP